MIVVIGLSHRTAPIEVRERLAIAADEIPGLLKSLISIPSLGEALVVSTCNRVEFVVAGTDGPRADLVGIARSTTEAILARAPGVSGHLYQHLGLDGVRHLFRVAASLDSLVVGEPQILGQVKQSYNLAREVGTTGSVLNRVVPRALRSAKRVRSQTTIGAPSAREYVLAGTMESREDAKKACEYMKRQYIPASVGPDGVSVMVPPAILHEAQEVLEGWLPGELYDEAAASATYVRHGMGTVRSYVYGRPELIEFVQEVFGAVELERFQLPHGAFRVEAAIGDSVIVLEVGNPAQSGGKPSTIHIYVPDVDAAWGRALELGASEVAAPVDKDYDERAAAVSDSSGNTWWIATYQA